MNGPLPALHRLHARLRCNAPLNHVSKRVICCILLYTHTCFESALLPTPGHLDDFVEGFLCRASARQDSFDSVILLDWTGLDSGVESSPIEKFKLELQELQDDPIT